MELMEFNDIKPYISGVHDPRPVQKCKGLIFFFGKLAFNNSSKMQKKKTLFQRQFDPYAPVQTLAALQCPFPSTGTPRRPSRCSTGWTWTRTSPPRRRPPRSTLSPNFSSVEKSHICVLQPPLGRFGFEDEYYEGSVTWWQHTKPRIWSAFDEPYSSNFAKVSRPSQTF